MSKLELGYVPVCSPRELRAPWFDCEPELLVSESLNTPVRKSLCCQSPFCFQTSFKAWACLFKDPSKCFSLCFPASTVLHMSCRSLPTSLFPFRLPYLARVRTRQTCDADPIPFCFFYLRNTQWFSLFALNLVDPSSFVMQVWQLCHVRFKVTYVNHLFQMLEESIQVSPFGDRVE